MILIQPIQEYIAWLKETETILKQFRLDYHFIPPAILINNAFLPPGMLDLSEILKIDIKIIGQSNVEIRTISDEIEYLTIIQSVLTKYITKKSEDILLTVSIIPALIYLKSKCPKGFIRLKITERGIKKLQSIILSK